MQLTDGNAFLTGTAVGIRTLPVLLIGPWAGVLADRVDRRKLVMVTQVYMAISAVIFALMVLATDLDVNIYDLEIAHSGEGDRGVVLLIVESDMVERLKGGLMAKGYRPTSAPLA